MQGVCSLVDIRHKRALPQGTAQLQQLHVHAPLFHCRLHAGVELGLPSPSSVWPLSCCCRR